jgi:hypothetical protein
MATEDMWAGIGEQAIEKPDETLVDFVQRKTSTRAPVDDEVYYGERDEEKSAIEAESADALQKHTDTLIAALSQDIGDAVYRTTQLRVDDMLEIKRQARLKLAHEVYRRSVTAFRDAQKKLNEHKPLLEMAACGGDDERLIERTREHMALQRELQTAHDKMLGMREFGNALFGQDTFYYDC